MAMPPHRSLLLLLIVAVSVVVSAAVTVTSADDNIAKVCGGGTLCVEMLTSMKPESSTASPRRAAELVFQYVLKDGAALSSETDRALAAPKDPDNVPCLETVESNLKPYVEEVAQAAPEKDFNGARDMFNKMLEYPSSTHSCSDVNEPVIPKVLRYEDRLQVMCDLFNKAAPPPPPPPPPAEE